MAEALKAPLIYKALADVMAEIGSIGKNKKNQQQGFMYRGVDDVMNALNPILVKNRVILTTEVLEQTREERQTTRGGTLLYSICKVKFTFYAEDGSNVSSIILGEGMDSGDKASNKAMSVAYKYAFFQMFCIPTEEMKDPDAESPEVTGRRSKPTSTKKEKVSTESKVGEQEISNITAELNRTGLSEEKICSAFGVKKISDMTTTQYTSCMNKFKVTPDKKGE